MEFVASFFYILQIFKIIKYNDNIVEMILSAGFMSTVAEIKVFYCYGLFPQEWSLTVLSSTGLENVKTWISVLDRGI
jgi:hypothetical protein